MLATRVAVIGPHRDVQDVLACAGQFPQLELTPYLYTVDAESNQLALAAAGDHEILLFTGPAPYLRAKELTQIQVPMLHVPFTDADLYRALYELKGQADLSGLSFDTFPPDSVMRIYREFGLPAERIGVLNVERAMVSDEVAAFHRERYKRGESTGAVTCWKVAHELLLSAGVPVLRIFPGHQARLDTLDRAALLGEGLRSKAMQIVVGMVEVMPETSRPGPHAEQEFYLAVQHAILSYVREIDGHLLMPGLGQYVFFTTRALLEKSSDGLSRAPLLARLRAAVPARVAMGLGMGATANQAAEHARTSLARARECGVTACFAILETKQLIGPLGDSANTVRPLQAADPRLVSAARRAGLHALGVERFVAAVRNLGTRHFTASDLAPPLAITDRSARRLVLRMHQAGLVRVVGQEGLATRGRPRQLYQLVL